MIDLHFNTTLAQSYRSIPQRTRVLTEGWMQANAYCPRCGRRSLTKYRNNNPVGDFFCEDCASDFELKSHKGLFGTHIVDGAYQTAVERIQSLNNPHFFMLSYAEDVVTDLCVVPNYFFTPALIEPRKPLSKHARRAGWQGCNIRIDDVPDYGRIYLVHSGRIEDPAKVVDLFQRTLTLQTTNLESRGWLLDVLRCLDHIPDTQFSLQQVYAFAPDLHQKHPDNHYIHAKIRQQLQLLRDRGLIEFTSRGHYRKLQ